jgi:hypothetical protein
VLTPFSGANHSTRTDGGALCTGADQGPGTEADVPCLTAGRSTRAQGAAKGRRRRLDLAPGRDPVGEERS